MLGSNEDRPSKFEQRLELRFVAALPGSKEARRETKAAIRAHASRVSWARYGNKSQGAGKSHKRPISLVNNEQQGHIRHPRDSLGASTEGPGSRGWSTAKAASGMGRRSNQSIENGLAMIGGPYALLGPGSKDPFASYPGHNLPLPMLDALEHSFETVWANVLVPREDARDLEALKSSWRRCNILHPHVFHTSVTGSSGFALVLSPDSQTRSTVLAARAEQYQRALERTSDVIRSFDGHVPEELLLCLCGLSTYSGDILPTVPQPHPISPLATAQSMHMFGDIKLIPQHLQALRYLTNLKGGLQAVHKYGNMDNIEWVDLFAASRTDEKPALRWVRGPSQLDTSRRIDLEPSQELGHRLLVISEIDDELYDLFVLAFKATRALEHYNSGSTDLRLFRSLVIARNETQHGLLSLKRLSETNDLTERDVLFEVCRLSGLIYNDLVLYPLPYSTGVKPRLAQQLYQVLQDPRMGDLWDSDFHELLIWVCFIGEIAARKTKDHGWFVRTLLKITRIKNLDKEGFTDLMQSFLWWDYVCLPPALELWEHLQEAMKRTEFRWTKSGKRVPDKDKIDGFLGTFWA